MFTILLCTVLFFFLDYYRHILSLTMETTFIIESGSGKHLPATPSVSEEVGQTCITVAESVATALKLDTLLL